MEGSLFIVTALLIGRLGAVPVAAHQIAINVASLCFMIPLGLAEATTVRVGHALGRGDRDGMRRAALRRLRAGAGARRRSRRWCCCPGAHALVALYTHDAAVAALAAALLLYAAAFQFPDGIQVLSAGALRGLKDTRVPMFLAAFAYWGVGMPLGAGLGLDLRLGAARDVDRADRRAWRSPRCCCATRFLRSSRRDRPAPPACAASVPSDLWPMKPRCTPATLAAHYPSHPGAARGALRSCTLQ